LGNQVGSIGKAEAFRRAAVRMGAVGRTENEKDMGSPSNAANGSSVPSLTVREAAAELTQSGSTAVLLDVREQWEYDEVRAQGARLIPLSELTKRVAEVPRDADVLLICHTGYRSMQAAVYLKRQGVARVFNVEGGTEEWEAAGLPVEHGAAR